MYTLIKFYFIENINLKDVEISENDWIVAFHDDIIVGARKWFGKYTDVPVMGNDGFSLTEDYCNTNQEVLIKNKNTEQILYNISGDNTWGPNNFEILATDQEGNVEAFSDKENNLMETFQV